MDTRSKEDKTIKAYQLVLSKNKVPFIHEMRKKLALSKLAIKDSHISAFIFGKNKLQIEMVARQFLWARMIGLKFNEQMLLSLAYEQPVRYQLPREWIKILETENVRVDVRKSTREFWLYILKKFVNNLRHGVIMVGIILFSRHKKKIRDQKKYVQFCDLTPPCLPWPGSQKDYTVLHWYINWAGGIKDISEIHHNLNKDAFMYGSYKVVSARHFFEYVTDTWSKVKLLGWFSGAVFIATYTLLLGRWVNALLLLEAFHAKIIDLTKDEFLAREYLFSISSFEYRPLWSYSAEKKGALVTNISYASSFGGFKTKNGYLDTEYSFDICTWPRLLYWTDKYISFIRSKVSSSVEVIKTPPIYFADYPFTFPPLGQNVVAIFDISPVEPYFFATLIPEISYRNFDSGKRFLTDIYEVLAKKGFTIIWKRKRSFHSTHNKEYIQFCDEFEKLPGVIAIHPDVSAFQVIENCDYCVSMPFTSTAFVASYYKKPSIFYDCTGILYKDDRASQGLPVISGKEELNNWSKQVVKEKIA